MSICYSCFEEYEGETCPHCGYDPKSEDNKNFHALKAGTILNGKYVLGRVIGQGGFGITYIAQNYETKELLAIKEYYPEDYCSRENGNTVSAFSSTEAADNFTFGKERFLDEAKTLSQFIGNENIVRIYSYFEENGTAYLVMEFVSGDGLDKYVTAHGGKLSVDEANALLMPIADALEYVHSKGVVHRDIAPDNIIITKDGTAKLIDFGAARYSTGEKTKSLDVILKHGFAPLEQYSRHGRQGPFTDLYAFAATYYYVITGRVPIDSIDRLNNDFLLVPSSLGVKISDVQETALLKALAVQYTDRFATVGDFKKAFFGEVAIEPQVKENAEGTKTREKTEPAKKKRSKKFLYLIPLIIVLLIGGIFGGLKLQESNTQKKNYSNALKYIDEGKYSEAIDILTTMDGYENSNKLVLESEYNLAQSYEENSDFDKAIELFESLGDYEDSKALINECWYKKGTAAIEAEDYEAAAEYFAKTEGSEDILARINKYIELDNKEIGEEVSFGTYIQNNSDSSPQSIEWIILDRQDDKLLLISKYAIDAQRYNDVFKILTWSESTLRKWLNDDFYNEAFSDEEKSYISPVMLDGNKEKDNVFLLSTDEANKYFLDNSKKACEPTDYAVKMGVKTSMSTYYDDSVKWWLRTPMYYVDGYGETQSIGSYNGGGQGSFKFGIYGVRPVLWLNLAVS